MTLAILVQAAAAIVGAIAAFLWWRSAQVHIRDNQDKFIEDLHEMSKWNLRASLANALLAFLLALSAALALLLSP
jgi:hypothetical protein